MSVSPPPADGPAGIGGWLILPILGFAGAFALTGWNLLRGLNELDGLLLILQSEGGPLSRLKLPLLLSLVSGVCVLGSALYCLYLVVHRSRRIYRVTDFHYGCIAIAGIVELWVDSALRTAIPETPADPSVMRDAVRGVVLGLIWSTYFHTSKRVKNTFVN